MQGTSQPTQVHSAYTRQQPPPYEPPPGVTEVTAWQLATSRWRDHLPDDLLGAQCLTCRANWPCDAWHIANDILNDCRETAANH